MTITRLLYKVARAPPYISTELRRKMETRHGDLGVVTCRNGTSEFGRTVSTKRAFRDGQRAQMYTGDGATITFGTTYRFFNVRGRCGVERYPKSPI